MSENHRSRTWEGTKHNHKQIDLHTIRVESEVNLGLVVFFSRIFRKDFGMFGRHDLNCVPKKRSDTFLGNLHIRVLFLVMAAIPGKIGT